MKPPALLAQDLTCTYHRWGQKVLALDRVSLTLPSGQWLMIAGHNGAGKSTLLRAMSGQITEFSGELLIDGQPVRQMSSRQRAETVYYVHQNPTLGSAPLLTV